ncbi:phage portal protein [Streptomyces chryseus]
MSILLGTRERRSFTFPSHPIPPNSASSSGSFARVDLSRTEASLQKVAVWSCVNLTATIAECMPVDMVNEDGKHLPLPAWMADLGGDGHGLPDWLYQYVYSLMLRGNGYGLTGERDRRRGTPTLIQLQHPDEVGLSQVEGRPQWKVGGRTLEDPEQMWHRRVHPVPGRTLGLSPIAVHAMTIGTGISAMRFGAQWFEEGAHPTGMLTTSKNLDRKQAATAKERFMAAIRGRREPVVLGGDWKYQTVQVKANESQFLETHGYTAAECCRIFGPGYAEIFGYETGGSLTYSNIEQRSLDFLTYAADPWLVRIETALSSLLTPGWKVRFNRAALVRTDLLTRYRAHAIALRSQFKIINEVRADEDWQPVAWGDKPVVVGAPGPEEKVE